MLSSGAGHAPALSVPLSDLPSSPGSSCPQLEPVRDDRTGSAVSFTGTNWLGDATDLSIGTHAICPTGDSKGDLAKDARLRGEVPS